jgi:DNA-binding NtrC family response regulator
MPSTILSQFREESRQLAARGRVLLVDGNRRDLDRFRSVLEAQGFEVCASLCCAEGLARLEEEAFDLVLIDQGGPAFEGRAVLGRVTELDRHTPAVVLTRCFDKGCYLEAMQLGAVDYLEKPLSPADTLRLAEKYLRPRKLAA